MPSPSEEYPPTYAPPIMKINLEQIDTALIELISTLPVLDADFFGASAPKENLSMFTPKGKFGWYELMTSDTKAAGKFYSDVVGWTTQEMPSSDGSQYTTFNVNNVGLAGMLNIPGHTAWVG